jgi:hypothetical protein
MNTTSRILGEAMTPRQKRIYKDPERAYNWARKYKQRFPEAEAAIARDPFYSHFYAQDVIGGPFPEGEPAIATSPGWALRYAQYVVKGRWPEGEATIAKDPRTAHYYARDFIRGRWPEAEPVIAKDPHYSIMYLEKFPEARLEWVMNGWIDWLDL